MSQSPTYIEIFRHAESEGNIGKPSTYPALIPLTETGHAQARALADSFNATASPELIITSPYLRTGETAAPTLARFPQAAHEVWPIQEFTYLKPACYFGTTQQQRGEVATRYWQRNDPDFIDGEGAESFAQMMMRVDTMLERFRALSQRHVLVFSHGLIMKATLLRLTAPTLRGQDLMREFSRQRRLNLVSVPNTARLALSANKDHVHILSRW